MNAQEAREHLDIAERILSQVEEPSSTSGYPFVVWGIAAAIMNCVVQLVFSQKAATGLLYLGAAALLTAIILTIVWVRSFRGKDRGSLIARHIAVIFNIAWIGALVAQIGAYHIFSQWAQAAIWSIMYGVALLSAGALVRSRVVMGGGVILLASVIAANFSLGFAGYVLALGDLIGLAGAGALLYAGRR